MVPPTMARANHIKYSRIKKKNRLHAVRENIWFRSDDTLAHFKYFNPVDCTLAGVTLTWLDPSFHPTQRMDARKGVWQEGKWCFSDLMVQTFSPDTPGAGTVERHARKCISLDITPADLAQVAKKSDEMGFGALSEYIKKVEAEGYDATTYRVDLAGKTAFPFICLIMAIMGTGVGMRSRTRENLPLGIVKGLGISFLYWIVHGFCISLGYGRMLPPMVSAWAADVLFLCAAIFYLTRTDV